VGAAVVAASAGVVASSLTKVVKDDPVITDSSITELAAVLDEDEVSIIQVAQLSQGDRATP